LIIKLIGIIEDKNKLQEAIEFLEKKTKNQQVFMKYDEQKFDEQNHLLCYLYLKNKTFLNAHLVKNDLVNVDNSKVFKHLNKFLSMKGYNE